MKNKLILITLFLTLAVTSTVFSSCSSNKVNSSVGLDNSSNQKHPNKQSDLNPTSASSKLNNSNTSGVLCSSAAEVTEAVKNSKPGDTIILKNGIWKDFSLIFQGKGTVEKPITLRAETQGEVVLTGKSSLNIAGEYLVVDGLYFKDGWISKVISFKNGNNTANHCRVTNTAIVNYNNKNKKTDTRWVIIYGTYNRVDHCYFRNKTNQGMMLEVIRDNSAQYHFIDHNYFGYFERGVENGAETMRIGTSGQSLSASYTTVESNYFEQCNGEVEIISNKSCNNSFINNTFYKSQGALTLRHGNDCIVDGNYFFGENIANTSGIRVIGERHKVINNYISGTSKTALAIEDGIVDSPLNGYYQVKDAVIANNTFVNNEASIILGDGYNTSSNRILAPLNCIISNNIILSTKGISPLINVKDKNSKVTYEGNIVFGNAIGITPVPEGIRVIDPKLSLKEDKLYRPVADSPIINASVGKYVEQDMDGQKRDDGKIDIGADEVSASKVLKKPLTARDVGPEWVVKKADTGDAVFKIIK